MNTTTPTTDEREGFASGSTLGRVLACPGSYQLSKIFDEPPPKEFTRAGSRIADLIHRLGTGAPIPDDTDEDELETAQFLLNKKATKFLEICEELGESPDDFTMLHEERLWYTHAGAPVYSGKFDTGAIHKSKPLGVVIDDKSGWMKQPPPWMNAQLKSYGLLLLQNFPNFGGKDFQIHVATNSRFWDRRAVLGYEELNEFHKQVVTTIPRVLESRPWAEGMTAGEHCRYCPARAQCPVLRFGMAQFEEAYGPPKIDIEAKVASMSVPEIETALLQSYVIGHAIKAIQDEAERRIQKTPDAFMFHSYESPAPRAQVGDIPTAASALEEFGITASEILACLRSDALTAGKTSALEKLLYRKLNIDPDAKVTHPQTFEKLHGALESAGALVIKTGAPRLVHDPEKPAKIAAAAQKVLEEAPGLGTATAARAERGEP